MATKNTKKYNEYMRAYMSRRYHLRTARAKRLLGGCCARCRSINNLEFDHINPKTKKFTIGSVLAGCSEKKFLSEIKKCQLLCRECHIEKTRKDLGQKNAKKTHGTLSSYKYCRCDKCKNAWNYHSKIYRRKWRKKQVL